MLRVGDLVLLEKNQRVPENMVLLRTSESNGTERIVGQRGALKLRVLIPFCQNLGDDRELLGLDAESVECLLNHDSRIELTVI